MTNKVKQRLCGGTFFTLLLQARKPRKGVREHYMGEVDGLSDPQTLTALIKIAVPDYSTPDASMMTTFKGNTSRYKSCQNNGGTYMPFGDKVTMQSFDNRVRTDYASALSLMCGFSEDFIDFGSSTRKDYWLVKALLELLDEDDSIDGEQEIYAREDGVATTKSAILAASTFCLQPLLLGLWHFALLNRADNRVGKDTYDLWCPATGGSERAYTYTLGETITRTICITYSTQSHPTVDTEIIDEDIVEDAGPEAQASLAMIDYALRRRFSFFEMDPGFDSEGFIKYQNGLNNDTLNELVARVKELNKEIAADRSLGKGFCIGHSYFCGQKVCTDEWLHSVVDYDILPMLSEYWFDDNTKLQRWENILHGVFQ